MFGVNRVFMEAFLASPEWTAKLERAKTSEEAVKVLLDFARERGFKVKYVENEGKKRK